MPSESADARIMLMLFLGLPLAVAAAAMIYFGWPESAPLECGEYGLPSCDEGGSVPLVIGGFVVGLAAQVMLFIGMIGTGVKYGTAAARG